MATRRLNWGCGPRPAPGCINSDLLVRPGIDVSGDVRDGLALDNRERESLFVEALK